MLFGHTKIPSPLGSQFDAHTSLQSYQFLFGPEVAYRGRQVQLFAHGLFGANHTAAVWDLSNNDSLSLIGRTHFALGAGVGLDVNFKEHFAYRVFQADYIPTLVDGRWEKNYRVSTGIVFRFKSLHGSASIHAFVMRRAAAAAGGAIHALHFPGVVADYCS